MYNKNIHYDIHYDILRLRYEIKKILNGHLFRSLSYIVTK